MNIQKTIIILLWTFFSLPSYSQIEDSIKYHLNVREVYTSKNFVSRYNAELKRLKRVYPMALKAKAMINEYEAELATIDKKRKQKKYGKNAHDELKEDFTFTIRDLYTKEGILLMQLIHRETGMTVNEIIKKYRGGVQASMYQGIGLMFEQDLNATYDPKGDNWITEIVLDDILSGAVPFDFEMDALTKEEFKKTQQEYKQAVKETRKLMREVKQKNREAKRNKKRENK